MGKRARAHGGWDVVVFPSGGNEVDVDLRRGDAFFAATGSGFGELGLRSGHWVEVPSSALEFRHFPLDEKINWRPRAQARSPIST